MSDADALRGTTAANTVTLRPTIRRVYLAARYEEHPRMRQWREILSARGLIVTSRWIDMGHEDRDEARYPSYALEDLADVARADALVALSDPAHFRTGRGGRHVELGYALALGRYVVLVGERENVFHWLCDATRTIEEAATLLLAPPTVGLAPSDAGAQSPQGEAAR